MSYVYINRLNMPYSFLNPIWASLLSTPVPNPSSRNFTCTNLTKLKITMSYAYTKSLNMPYPSSIQSRVSFLSTPVQNPSPRNFTCINLTKLKITMSYAYTDSPYSAYMCRKSPWPQFKCFKQLFETNRPLLWWKVHIDQKGKTAITNNGKKKLHIFPSGFFLTRFPASHEGGKSQYENISISVDFQRVLGMKTMR